MKETTAFNKDHSPWVRAAQKMLGHQLTLIPNEELTDHSLYAVEGHLDLLLKAYNHARIQFLWKGRPVPTRYNSELDQRLLLKYKMEAPLPFNAMTKTAVSEALEFASDLK